MSEDNPGIRIPPPLVLFSFFLVGLAFRPFFPVAIPYGTEIGIALGVVAVGLVGWAIGTMRRAQTAILPHKPASALVTHGPFGFSRNPIYVALILIYLDLSFWLSVVPALILLPIALLVFHFYVIQREEAYLTRHFGDDYREYCRRVRRWL